MKTFSLRVRVATAVAMTCISIVVALGLTLHTASEELEHSYSWFGITSRTRMLSSVIPGQICSITSYETIPTWHGSPKD